ncbi:MAG: hypothetical protein AMJ93_09550, partial [Anaerolineae bacterium SM23_84]
MEGASTPASAFDRTPDCMSDRESPTGGARMKRSLSNVAGALIVLGVLLSLWPASLAAQPPRPFIESAADHAMAKLEPSLRSRVAAGGEELVGVAVRAVQGTDVSRYMIESLTRPFVDDGEQTTFGKVRANSVLKLAGLPGVRAIQALTFAASAAPPPPPDGHTREAPPLGVLRSRMGALKALDVPWSATATTASEPLDTGWFDVLDSHKSSKAWAKGYRGEGVFTAVIDDGVDFAHPDLM